MAFLPGYLGPGVASRRCLAKQGGSLANGQSVHVLRCPTAVATASGVSNSRRQQPLTRLAAVAEALQPPAASELPIEGAVSSPGSDADPLQQPPKVDRPIRVGDKPASNALLRRLETVPQTVIRAVSNTEQHTYKTIATVATAQKQLKQPNKVLLYVPFTRSTAFTALVLPASDTVQQSTAMNYSSSSTNTSKLIVKASTDPKALANTLTFDLIKKGSATLTSAGAAATAKAAAALALVREQLLSRGYEVGVLPRFDEGQGKEKQITILTQQVILQELPTPRVTLPRNETTPLTKTALKAQGLLQKQRRVQLLLPHNQLSRLTDAVAQIMAMQSAEQQQQQQEGEGGSRENTRGRGRASRAATGKKRLILVWPPSTAEQLLESLDLSHLPAAAADASAAAATAAHVQQADPSLMLSLQLRQSRLTSVPLPRAPTHQQGLAAAGGSGLGDAQKPAVATADSSVAGLAGAIAARVNRSGAAWLWSDGSVQGNTAAWAALIAASRKMDTADGAGALMALVDVQTTAAAAASSAKQQQQQQQQQGERQQQDGGAVVEAGSRNRLKMLILRYNDIAKNILQSPNTPMEVSVTTDLWPLLKFATAANTFLPVSAQTGSGALLLLPAVLPAPEPAAVAADYRFEDQNTKQQLVPYAIRVQRFTGSLPEGMQVADKQQLRVSLNTDPIKLRDAIVAKVLQQEPASVRFVGPVGRAPPLLSIAMAAVAAARVRLQQKGARFDLGVIPYAESLLLDQDPAAAAAAAAAAGIDHVVDRSEAAARGKKGASRGKQATAASSRSQAGRVVYSLRLVPLPPVTKVNGDAAAAAAHVDAGL